MYDETQLLKRLIDDLRTLSLADAGELKLFYQSVQPRELLERHQAVVRAAGGGTAGQLQVEADDDLPAMQIDRERMAQVLANLVSNALRYTPSGGIITLLAHRQTDRVRTGRSEIPASGMEADKLPYIFERFYRIEQSRHQSEGESGLGLAIAKSIVEAHHGAIKAESRLGAGTSIIITPATFPCRLINEANRAQARPDLFPTITL